MEAVDQVAGLETEYTAGRISQGKTKAIVSGSEFCQTIARAVYELDPREYDNPMGARVYMDQHKIEGATPECAGIDAARTLVLYVRATDATIHDRFWRVLSQYPASDTYYLFKSSTDWKGNWYGSHLNVRMPISVEPWDLRKFLAPFLATSIIWAGQGGVEPFCVSEETKVLGVRFVLSPRALSIGQISSFDAMNCRGLFTTKSFRSGDDDMLGWGRIEILMDPLCSDVALYVYTGIVLLIVRLLASGKFPQSFLSFPEESGTKAEHVIIKRLHQLSRHPLQETVFPCGGAGMLSALEVQERYYDLLSSSSDILHFTKEDRSILELFGWILSEFRRDPLRLASISEAWFLRSLTDGFLKRHHATWSNACSVRVNHKGKRPRVASLLQMLSHQAGALDEEQGLWRKAESRGMVRSLFSKEEIERAKNTPPFSRAMFRRMAFLTAHANNIDLVIHPHDAWNRVVLFGHGRAVNCTDPTGRSNGLYAEELMEHMRAIIRERAAR